MNKVAEIEKLKKQLEKEYNSESIDKVKVNEIKKKIFHLGLGLTFNDINKI
jgi:hypothetical protein